MKKVYGLLLALFVGAAAMAQATPHEKAVVRNDVAREHEKRHEVARDIVHGQPAEARADHRAAVAYHKQLHRDVRQVHRNEVHRRRTHHYVRHHYRPRRHYVHHRTTVVIRH